MSFRPLHDRVVVRRLDSEEKTAGGIIIPDTAKEKPSEGEVISVGPGARDENGKIVAARRQGRRPRALRQVERHRSQDQRRRPSDHEGIRHHGCDRGLSRCVGAFGADTCVNPAHSAKFQEHNKWLPKT